MASSGMGTGRRQLLGHVGAAAALGLVSACSGGTGLGTSVGWQAIPSYSLQAPDPKRADYLKHRLSAFRRRGGLSVKPLVSSNDVAAAMSKLLLQASQRRAPEVAQVDSYIFGRTARYAQPLEGQMRRLGLRLDDWVPSARDVMTSHDGSLRGMQFTSDIRVLYYRKDLVRRPPSDWDELLDMAGSLSRSGHQLLFPAGRSEGAVTTTLWPAYWSQGAELFDGHGEPAFASGRGYEAMLRSLRQVERAVTLGIAPRRVANFDLEDDVNPDVVAGRAALFLGGNWQADVLDSLMARHDFFREWGVAPLPVTGGGRRVSATGGWLWASFAGGRAALETGFDWLDSAFLDDAAMARWCSLGGYLPPRQSVYEREDYQGNAFTPAFRDQLSRYGKARPADRRYTDVSHTMQVALSGVASGSLTARQALDEALARLV